MNNRILFGILSILNAYGIPSFMNGYISQGILRIVITLVGTILAGIPGIILLVLGVINCIKILQMTDEQFEAEKANFGAKLFG